MKRFAVTVGGAILLALLTWGVLYYDRTAWFAPPPPAQVQKAPELYVRIAAVYAGEFNGSPAGMVEKALLEQAAASFGNVPILLAHEHSDLRACVGRTFAARVSYDAGQAQFYLEVDAKIVDPEAIRRIKTDQYHSVSIGFSTGDMTCSIDGMDARDCQHTPGRYYKVNGTYQMARVIFKKMVGLEISFVNVPGSRYARVLTFADSPAALGASK